MKGLPTLRTEGKGEMEKGRRGETEKERNGERAKGGGQRERCWNGAALEKREILRFAQNDREKRGMGEGVKRGNGERVKERYFAEFVLNRGSVLRVGQRRYFAK